jgi:integrase
VRTAREDTLPAIPAYRRRKIRGRAVAYLTLTDSRTHARRDYSLGEFNSPESRQLYARLTAEWLAAGRRLPMDDPARASVAEVLVQYRRACIGRMGTGEAAAAKQALRVAAEVCGMTPAARFGPKLLRTVRQRMIAKGWSRPFINRQVLRLRAAFRWACSEELIPPALHHGLAALTPLRQGEAPEPLPITPVEIEAVELTRPWLPRVVRAMVDLQLLTGARGGEIRMLRRRDIVAEGDVWRATLTAHKTAHHGKRRTLLFGPRAQEILRPYLLRAPEAFLFSPAECVKEHRGQDRRRSRRAPGKFYTKDSYCRAITRACDAADRWAHGGAAVADEDRLVPRWHPHQLRHTAATEIRRQFGLEAAALVLGHASARVTDAVYAERDTQKAVAVAKAVG